MTLSTRRRFRLGLLVLLWALVVACTPGQVLVQAGIPGTYTRATLSELRERADYLDAVVETAGYRFRFFFPRSEECRETLVEGSALQYAHLGSLGRVRRGDSHCDPIGILSLAQWRDRGPRQIRRPVPRAQAKFEVFYRDEDLALARGRFPLAGEIRWTGGLDTVGVIPIDPDCESILSAGVASMQFRVAGKDPFVLVGEERFCTMLGFARPVLD